MQKKRYLYFILSCSFFAITFNSCTYKYFAPKDHVGLQVSEKGDLKVAGSFSTLPGDLVSEEEQEGIQYSLQTAYSPLSHLSIAANFSQVRSSDVLDERSNLTKAYALEAAVGSYIFVNTKELPKQVGFLFDFYGGYGINRVNNSYERIDTASFSARKFYFQGGAYLLNKSPMGQKKLNFSMGFTVKAGTLFFNKGTFLIKEAFYNPIDDGEEIVSFNPQSHFRFSETSINLQLGIRPVMFYTNLSISTSAAPEFLRYFDNSIKVGLVWNIGDLLFKERAPKLEITPNADLETQPMIQEELPIEEPKIKKTKKAKQREKARAKALKAKEKAKKKREKEKAKKAKKRAKMLNKKS